ncbi:MAG: rhodanese-like domain-containing protein [Acidobacteriota bacterium]
MASGAPRYAQIDPVEAEHLVRSGRARVLDVRTPEEFASLGHIPGAILLPLDLLPSAAATLPRDGAALLVCCEHGVRSAAAARFLARAGLGRVLTLAGGMSCWAGPRDHGPGDPFTKTGPSSWLVECADLLPRDGKALDLACGSGRHALLLAARGLDVRAVDRDEAKIRGLGSTASRLGLPVRAEVLDLEDGEVDLGADAYELILGIRYLYRPLFVAIRRALAPGGLLLYETFTVAQAARGRPTNPAFLLGHGELPRLVAPLEVVRAREGEHDGGMVAAVAARRPARSGR